MRIQSIPEHWEYCHSYLSPYWVHETTYYDPQTGWHHTIYNFHGDDALYDSEEDLQ